MKITVETLTSHKDHSIISWCTNINLCLRKELRLGNTDIHYLTLAHTLGWIGYTLFDDLNDMDRSESESKNCRFNDGAKGAKLSELCNWFINKSREIFLRISTSNELEAFNLMNKSYSDPPISVLGLWRRSAGILCAPNIILQNHTSTNKISSEHGIRLAKLYLCKKHIKDDYIDLDSDLVHQLVTPLTALTVDLKWFCNDSKIRNRFVRMFLQTKILTLNHLINNLLDQMRYKARESRQSLWTKSGVEMFAKLLNSC